MADAQSRDTTTVNRTMFHCRDSAGTIWHHPDYMTLLDFVRKRDAINRPGCRSDELPWKEAGRVMGFRAERF